MADNRDLFEQWLMLYGASVDHWPDDLSARGRALMTADPSLAALVAETEAFEARLRLPETPMASSQLSARIIDAGRRTPQQSRPSLWRLIESLIAETLPKPSYALASVLLLGMFLGYVTATAPAPSADQLQEINLVRDVIDGEGSLL